MTIWVVILYFRSPQPSHQFIPHNMEFLGPGNIPLGTKSIFLAALETKICVLLYLSGHLGLFKNCYASVLKKSRFGFRSDCNHRNNDHTFRHFQISFSLLLLFTIIIWIFTVNRNWHTWGQFWPHAYILLYKITFLSISAGDLCLLSPPINVLWL